MNISLSTSVAQGPVTTRQLPSRAQEQVPPAQEHPGPHQTSKKNPLARVAAATERNQRRVKGAMSEQQLSTRQSMALDKVQQRFDNMTKRLQQAVETGGADRSGLRQGLDIVYGKLRDSLSDILAASDGPTVSKHRHPEEITGLTLNKLG